LENHLYRIEVHSATNTTAKVKWSRENAHVSTAIVEIMAGRTTVRVESLGRDNVLRFKTGDWVEFTSDTREFAGLPGDMRKVTVDDTNKTVTFSPALPVGDFPQGVADATKHLRVIRWDQTGIVRKPDGSQLVNLDLTTDGLIELSAANPSFVLEHGVQATLTVQAGGTPHSGDYWCFAARTADADIERLNVAPPLGLYGLLHRGGASRRGYSSRDRFPAGSGRMRLPQGRGARDRGANPHRTFQRVAAWRNRGRTRPTK
jgi:hypothetical protein